MSFDQNAAGMKQVTIYGIVVRLSFAKLENTIAPQMIRDILKGAYLNKKKC